VCANKSAPIATLANASKPAPLAALTRTLAYVQALALTILGSITFLPGLYYTRIAYYAWKGVPGYSYDQIPETD
jgi:Transmembrane proteins 230/134